MTKNAYILFLLVVALLISPTQIFASATQAERSCCSTDAVEMPCCTTNDTSSSKSSSCHNTCENASCSCPMLLISPVVFLKTQWIDSISPFSVTNKPQFSYTEIAVTSAYSKIWLPPKIA